MLRPTILKLKKYLFLISILFVCVLFGHLLYLYLYNDAETTPVKGGTVTEGLIGNFPSLNPLKILSSNNQNNQYLVGLLYRSLLRYDLDQGKIIGDIANCDISTLINIECYINENAKWSNGENITAEDVYATYNLIKETNSDIILNSLLEETTIEYKDNIITFNNNKQDVNFLNVFFQPILAKSTIDSLSEENIFGNFPTSGGLYSGNFKLSNVSSDLTIGVSKITLDKNEYYNTSNISKIILNIYPNNNSFQKNGQSVNIFNDNENIVGKSIPRLQSYKYTLPQFVALYLNQNNISNINLRTFILNKINPSNLVDLLGKDSFEIVNNPYLTETELTKEPNIKNFESIMSSLGYYKKSHFIESLTSNSVNNSENTYSEETGNIDIPEDISIDDFQSDSEYILRPEYVDIYNFVTKDDILLEGKVSAGVTEVYINDYKLTGFNEGDSIFHYRLRTSYDNIQEGRNSYKIYFVENGEKVFKEEIHFLYYKSRNTLNSEERKLVEELYLKKIEEENAQQNDTKQISPDEINQQELIKYNTLDENMYYNNNLNVFSLRLYYFNEDKNIDQTAKFIQNSLKELGIEVDVIPFDSTNISRVLANKDEYDMILAGINLGYFEFNIFPYFHSSQSKNGYNFSNIKKTSLDLFLEDLKSNILNEEKIAEIETKILEILKEEQVVKTLYTPKINLLVDKDLKIEKAYTKLSSKHLRAYVLNSSYTKDEKIINYENKSFFGFFDYIFKKLYE